VTPRAPAVAAALLGSVAVPAVAEEVLLRAAHPAGAPIELRAAPGGAAWYIRVLDAGRHELQRIEVGSNAAQARPWLGDADGDDAADLWLPVTAGDANTEYEVWFMPPAEVRRRWCGVAADGPRPGTWP
jgi:hypothetical protein